MHSIIIGFIFGLLINQLKFIHMTLQDYQRREWLFDNYDYRAVDQDGMEAYYELRPNLSQKMWVSSKKFTEWKTGNNISRKDASAFWEDSLQSRDQFLNLQNIEK